jgi:hypothetical protein
MEKMIELRYPWKDENAIAECITGILGDEGRLWQLLQRKDREGFQYYLQEVDRRSIISECFLAIDKYGHCTVTGSGILGKLFASQWKRMKNK